MRLILVLVLVAPLVAAGHGAFVPAMVLTAQQVPAEIRPGAWMESPAACTMAFVLRDGAGKLYVTTAGHCVDAVGQAVRVRGVGEVGFVRAFRFQGADDQALVEIHPWMYGFVNPRMVGWGGPTGVAEGGVELEVVKHYGFGYQSYPAHATRCKESVALFADSREYEASGWVSNGDSGGPILTEDGRALGLTNFGVGVGVVVPVAVPGYFGGVRFSYALAWMEGATGLDLELVPGGPVNSSCEVV